jgi:hypothetical protein
MLKLEKSLKAIDIKRREFLIKALGSGAFMAGASNITLPAWAMGKIPDELPPGRSIFELNGSVSVNSKPAKLDTLISTNSIIETGENSNVIFVVGKDAFILRDNGKLEIKGGPIISGLRLITGKLLSVFGERKPAELLGIKTVVATIGIRGTGVYVESEPDQTYICTCYGHTKISSTTDPESTETIKTKHHDTPRYVLAKASAGQKIKKAPVINHTDDELELVEALVGRVTPFDSEEY